MRLFIWFHQFWVYLKTLKYPFEINWPLLVKNREYLEDDGSHQVVWMDSQNFRYNEKSPMNNVLLRPIETRCNNFWGRSGYRRGLSERQVCRTVEFRLCKYHKPPLLSWFHGTMDVHKVSSIFRSSLLILQSFNVSSSKL